MYYSDNNHADKKVANNNILLWCLSFFFGTLFGIYWGTILVFWILISPDTIGLSNTIPFASNPNVIDPSVIMLFLMGMISGLDQYRYDTAIGDRAAFLAQMEFYGAYFKDDLDKTMQTTPPFPPPHPSSIHGGAVAEREDPEFAFIHSPANSSTMGNSNAIFFINNKFGAAWDGASIKDFREENRYRWIVFAMIIFAYVYLKPLYLVGHGYTWWYAGWHSVNYAAIPVAILTITHHTAYRAEVITTICREYQARFFNAKRGKNK